MGKALLIALALMAFGTVAQAEKVSFPDLNTPSVFLPDDITPDQKESFHEVLTHFVDNACPFLRLLGPKLVVIMSGNTPPEAAYRTDKFGWEGEVSILMIDTSLKYLNYYTGVGHTPGVIVKEQMAADVCGMVKANGLREVNPGAGGDLFYPTPVLR